MSKKILLISSDFFSYHKMIQNELERQGWQVTYLSDRPSNNTFVKILIRKFKWLISFYLTSFYKKKLAEVAQGQKFNQVLIIKGEALTPSVFRELRQYTDGKITLYYWDNIKNVPGGLENSHCADRVFTFDPTDTKRFNFALLPLFYISDSTSKIEATAKWDLSFIGSIHSDRLKVIAAVKKEMANIGSAFIFIYYPSKVLFIFRRLFDSAFASFQKNEFSLRPLAKAETDEVFKKSKTVLDVHHVHQTGLTMRTIEALALGKKLITTNASINTYPFYDPSQILIIDRQRPKLDRAFFELANSSVTSEAIKAYEIRHWVQTLTY